MNTQLEKRTKPFVLVTMINKYDNNFQRNPAKALDFPIENTKTVNRINNS